MKFQRLVKCIPSSALVIFILTLEFVSSNLSYSSPVTNKKLRPTCTEEMPADEFHDLLGKHVYSTYFPIKSDTGTTKER